MRPRSALSVPLRPATPTPVAPRGSFAALRPGHVLEAVGSSGCGKTELLVQAAVTCILPEAAHGVRYGGNGGASAGGFASRARALVQSDAAGCTSAADTDAVARCRAPSPQRACCTWT